MLKGQFEQWEFESDDQKSEVWDEIEHDVLMHVGDGELAAYAKELALRVAPTHGTAQ